ncbi:MULTISPECIES: hypothetical protein [unclassified Duganella]|jgi:hypothetical protein|uniref:hypothetical protein n=1 Tax=unclassified Duganella TaxID=2636909 RepID=UPI000890422C|nr:MULTISPECIES: hypothetical protein [unclassified Duganella]SDF70351.1 hypothetical protein SAMN05216320_1011032 [Duganella sp. OV458]SDI58952.1 hypothetical protein SAMN05428973_101383 [Duganella sp. OV510]
MNAATRHGYRILLAQLVNNTASFRMMKRITLLLVVAEIVLLSLYSAGTEAPLPLLMIAVPWGMLQTWCGSFMSSAVLQNRPEYACLVPHLRSRLMVLTAALYCANSVLLGLLTGVVFGHPGYGLLAGMTISTLSMFMHRFNVLAWVMAFVVPAIIPLVFNVLPHVLIAIDRELLLTAVGVLIMLPLGACGLQLIFPRGGERHWAWHARFTRQQNAMAGKTAKISAVQGGQRWQRWIGRLYAGALRQDSQPGVAPARRMMHVLGPAAYGGSYMAYALLTTVGALVIGMLCLDGGNRSGVLAAAGCLQLSAALAYVISVVDNVPRYSAEQRMYFLTPAAPAVADINRMIGKTLLRRFFCVWLVTLVCAVVLDSVAMGRFGLRGSSFALAMGMLWVARPLMRDYATMQPDSGRLDGMVAIVLVTLIILAIMAVADRAPAFPWYEIGVASGIAAAINLAMRWRKLMAMPPVLPAGRLAA